MRVLLIVVFVASLAVAARSESIDFDGVWRTFAPNAISGHATPLPLLVDDATSDGWVNITECVPGLGIRFAKSSTGPSGHHPLTVYFTSGGQIAGVGTDIYGSSSTSSVGNAAQDNLVKRGFWNVVPKQSKQWTMAVIFRDPTELCSNKVFPELVGDRAVINPNQANFALPLTASAAVSAGFAPGSCMTTMGRHHFLDLDVGHGQQSWVEGQLLPVVPMYWPPDNTGVLHAFFFTTPVVQPGSYLAGFGDWESPFLPDVLMCQNWCDDNCHWTTKAWSTMHIYMNSAWRTIKCPGGSGPVGRECPNGQ